MLDPLVQRMHAGRDIREKSVVQNQMVFDRERKSANKAGNRQVYATSGAHDHGENTSYGTALEVQGGC